MRLIKLFLVGIIFTIIGMWLSFTFVLNETIDLRQSNKAWQRGYQSGYNTAKLDAYFSDLD